MIIIEQIKKNKLTENPQLDQEGKIHWTGSPIEELDCLPKSRGKKSIP